jgi:hypothetical protein
MEQRIIAIIIAAAVIVAGIFWVVATDRPTAMDVALYDTVQLKAAVAPDGTLKLFAQAPRLWMTGIDAQGEKTPRDGADGGLVLGALEAKMMLDEKLIDGVGSPLTGFFGIDTRVDGILTPTGGLLDDLHVLSTEQFERIQGPIPAFVLVSPEGMPKLFIFQTPADVRSGAALAPDGLKLPIAEGDARSYYDTVRNGKTYTPVLIGAAEAKMMREELLFSKPGDTIDGLFGRDVIIAGVLAETKTSLDMAHIVPVGRGGWG